MAQIYPQIEIVNESNLIVYFAQKISDQLPAKIAQAVKQLEPLQQYIVDLTPSYTSLLIGFNPLSISGVDLAAQVTQRLESLENLNQSKPIKLVEIPVYYSPETGLDLEDTAQTLNLSIADIIELHSQVEYTVFALGFMPGFAFMGSVDERLQLPRLSTPRAKVPKGSVAITEMQTAVYPQVTPGGWRLLGRSPMCLFDSKRNPPQPYRIGDRIRFTPISKQDYLSLGGEL